MRNRITVFLLSVAILILGILPLRAQAVKPFILPVAAPPGAGTWLMGQPYGNTVGAFLRGSEWYEAGQRLHFGIDMSMPCGTPLVAIGDGTVAFVDDLGFGSGPHNLLIRHDAEGLISLYGHLLERPTLVAGQPVVQGQEIGLSGDPDITCDSRPHLHLEIRALNYVTAYNPADVIEADWHSLMLVGSFRYPLFQQDLDNARRWIDVTDQPDTAFGGRALNVYAAPYPDLREGEPAPNPPLPRDIGGLVEMRAGLRRLAFDGCCANAYWDAAQSETLYTIDGAEGQRANIFSWNAADGTMTNMPGQAPPPRLSSDGAIRIDKVGDAMQFTRATDGAVWSVETGGAWASFSADLSRLMWRRESLIANPGAQGLPTDIQVSDGAGENGVTVLSGEGLSAQWLDGSRLLIAQRETITTTLSVLDVATGQMFPLGAWNWLRGLTVAPGGGRLLFFLAYGTDPQAGIYTIETRADATAVRLAWFGGWRWRDASSLYYVPLDTGTPYHTLHIYDLVSGEDRALPGDQPFIIANGDWTVSADGRRIAFWNALDLTTWILEPAA